MVLRAWLESIRGDPHAVDASVPAQEKSCWGGSAATTYRVALCCTTSRGASRRTRGLFFPGVPFDFCNRSATHTPPPTPSTRRGTNGRYTQEVNARIVVIGLSTCAVGMLKALLLSSSANVKRVTLISEPGISRASGVVVDEDYPEPFEFEALGFFSASFLVPSCRHRRDVVPVTASAR